MEALINKRDGFVLRRIDIRDWKSEVSTQYKIERLPTVWLYDGKKRICSNARDVLARLRKLE